MDIHSHLGVMSVPQLDGANDVNSGKGPILPWLRAVDALNTHDAGEAPVYVLGTTTLIPLLGYENAIAGGLTTALILPGSGNAIGMSAFTRTR